MPAVSGCKFRATRSDLISQLCWACLIQNSHCSFVSTVVSGSLMRSVLLLRWSELCANLRIHAHIRKALCRLNFSSRWSISLTSLTAMETTSRNGLASALLSVDGSVTISGGQLCFCKPFRATSPCISVVYLTSSTPEVSKIAGCRYVTPTHVLVTTDLHAICHELLVPSSPFIAVQRNGTV